jgi:hypothetical protein
MLAYVTLFQFNPDLISRGEADTYPSAWNLTKSRLLRHYPKVLGKDKSDDNYKHSSLSGYIINVDKKFSSRRCTWWLLMIQQENDDF